MSDAEVSVAWTTMALVTGVRSLPGSSNVPGSSFLIVRRITPTGNVDHSDNIQEGGPPDPQSTAHGPGVIASGAYRGGRGEGGHDGAQIAP
jgi:hypothetical protein